MKHARSLILVWAGQIVSLFGSGLTGFALGVWLYQRTGSASNFALVALCSVLPQLLLSPFAGVLVDRYPRRWMIALADTGSALCTLAAAALFLDGQIQVWHIYLVTGLSASFGALQAPASGALIAALLPKEQLARANGMLQLGQGLAEILAPALAGVLVGLVGVGGVLLIDLVTYVVAVSILLAARSLAASDIRIANVAKAGGGPSGGYGTGHAGARGADNNFLPAGAAGFLSELRAGLNVLRADPGLRALLAFQALFSFLWSLFAVLVTPMVLGFARPAGLGLALTVAGTGMLGGSLVMSLWGGPKRRLAGLLAFELLSALAFVLMGLRPSLLLVSAAAFAAHFTLAFVSSLNDSLWQGQAPAQLRGRVLALKQAAVKAATLLAYLVAGALADRVLQPLLLPGSPLAGSLGQVLGVGPGRGIALLLVGTGVVKALAALWLSGSALAREVAHQAEGDGLLA